MQKVFFSWMFSKMWTSFDPDSWMEMPAFGTALEEHLKKSNREIALPIEACIMMLLETGMKEEVHTMAEEEGRNFAECGTKLMLNGPEPGCTLVPINAKTLSSVWAENRRV